MVPRTSIKIFTCSFNFFFYSFLYFKVRINACIALMSINLSENNSLVRSARAVASNEESIYLRLWLGLMETFSKLKHENIDATNELPHKQNLMHQICKLMTFLCKHLKIEDLESLMTKCLNQLKVAADTLTSRRIDLTLNELRAHFLAYIGEILGDMENNKQEIQLYNEALTLLNLLNANKRTSSEEDCVNLLINVLQRPNSASKSVEESDVSESESNVNEIEIMENKENNNDSEFRRKFPFKQTYD